MSATMRGSQRQRSPAMDADPSPSKLHKLQQDGHRLCISNQKGQARPESRRRGEYPSKIGYFQAYLQYSLAYAL
ncbi:hypothetical protein CLAFUW4_07194 [Fulvia fulva]|uniref:Uncharacterized protein n=1 Tax=Passalora fulva TaxID=5499 RepID=A0A9Q8UR91_PASFU|nr:uncharacterized protein CLAFUR5_07328 [Fulvia fulva]KAK4621597.1 hypothetical protein CLAFUR4_07202 [Fulvia fulva]KAK4623062.1 hypothetical protein CLAFUR0_07199 [Fulvia fulva]UJO19480.1 hypothetical protein CLAFUR5_07328 [Fulvia fulva]WPV16312.1 hypothetical protein CLAFUW4_07194 [Fulvia fulva]WPV31527.1 hypothetical protein CLAFUW7_07195 [Fulvia fulva]